MALPTTCPSGITPDASGQCPPQLPAGLEFVVTQILGVLARLIGLAVFVMLIVAGYNFLTAAGDPKKVEAAQKTITAAIVGIVIIIAGWFLLNLLQDITGVNLTCLSLSIPPQCP